MADRAVDGEHHIQMPALPGAGHGGRLTAAPEKRLNHFVRFVAAIERVGNALGTLAFTWATVILLGGYPTVLRSKDDFWLVTTVVFLEAARMFSRGNRPDYQLFFRTRGAIRPLGWNGLIVIVYFSDVLVCTVVWKMHVAARILPLLMLILLTIVQSLCPGALGLFSQQICSPLRAGISLWSPMVAIILLVPSIPCYYDPEVSKIIFRSSMTKWIAYVVLLMVVVLLMTISRMRFPLIIKLVRSSLGSKVVFWRQSILNLSMVAAIVMSVFMLDRHYRVPMIIVDIFALFIVSFGNLQIPAAATRFLLAESRLQPQYYYADDAQIDKKNLGPMENLAPSLNIFYVVVLCQGILYFVACILELFSFMPRRFLVRRGGFRGQWGVESVNLYYAYALDKCMEGGVLGRKEISLSTFAMDSLNSDSPKMQLYGVQTLNTFLQREATRKQLIAKLTTSMKTMARLISMLDWTSTNHAVVRLYAAKVIAEVAKSFRVATIPGTVQLVSALLDTDGTSKRENPLLYADDQQEDPIHNKENSQEERQNAIGDASDNQGQRQEPLQDTANLLETQTRSTPMNERNSFILRSWQRISKYWSIPEEKPLTDYDILPALGMSIVDSLAGCDQDNCTEISRASDLIQKIIGFTTFRSDLMFTDAQQKVLVKSSLKVLQKLTSIEGEIGITLRYKVLKYPFLLRNLGETLGNNNGMQERKLVAGILRNLAIEGVARQEIGRIHVLISSLIKAFLNSDTPSSVNVDHLLPKVAGQALAMLSMESVHNCLVMLKEPDFINKLKNMILVHSDKYIFVAASLLRNMCLHAQHALGESDLKELSHTLRDVLERIMDKEGAELEIFIGLSSQICKVIPEEFSRELEHGQIKRRFMKRLVDALNANMTPSAQCPGIRRAILEQSIYMMEYNSEYANCFSEFRMMEALSIVEETPSMAENYMFFLGDTGFMEHSTPLYALVSRAKELMGCQWLQGISRVN